MSVAAAGLLAGNLLTLADSDFESGAGSWVSNANASSIAQSSAASFTGTHSLTWTATSSALSSVKTGTYAVTAGVPYVASCWVETGTAQQLDVNINWFDGGTFLSSSNGTAVTVTPNLWNPLVLSGVAPATATLAAVFVQAPGAGAGNVFYLDLVFFAQSLVQILAAWPSGPLASTPVYADMTPWVRADKGVTYTRGRADETSTVQAGSCGFTLDNSAPGGWFSPGNASSPFTTALTGGAVSLGKRVQVNFADQNGWHTRCTNFVTMITPSWDGGPGLASTVKIQAQDLLAWLSRDNELRTMIEEEMLLDSPMCLYALADPSGSKTAADSSGNAAAPLREVRYGPTAAIAFGSNGSIIGAQAPGFSSSALASATFTPYSGLTLQLEGYLPSPVKASSGFSVECWYSFSTASLSSSSAIVPVSVAHSRTGAAIVVALNTNSPGQPPALFFLPSRTSSSPTVSATFTVPLTPGSVVLTVSGTTATLYLNGSSVASITVPSGFTADYFTVGGPSGGTQLAGYLAAGNGAYGWSGSLNCAAVYPSVLSTGRITAHWTAGSGQNYGQLISTLVSNILKYEGIPSSLQSIDTGASYADAYEITGQTPLSVIQLYQQVDGGVFYVSAAGQLAWQDRTARYAAQVTPALTLQAGQYEADLNFPVSTQYLVDDATFANTNIPGGVRAVNATAVAANGTYPDGDPLSPVTGPWYSLAWYGNSSPVGVADADVLTDAVNWEVNIYGNPVPRSPNLTIDLATQAAGTGTQVSRAACYGTDVGSVIDLATLPASAPAGTRVAYLMVEGVTETFTRDNSGITWTLQFNTSPASYSAAWIAGDANMGVLDSTAVVGRGTDGSPSGGSPATYVGPPYDVPAFSSGLNLTGNVGANDMRGLAYNTQLDISPPCAVAQQVSLAQSVSTSTNTDVQWDTVWYDTFDGFSLSSNATSYVVSLPGVYLLMAIVAWGVNGTGYRKAWFQQNGSVVGNASLIAAFATDHCGSFITTQVSCSTNDVLKVTCFQTSGSSVPIATADGGSMFAVLWLGT